MPIEARLTGYPRIGPHRELKRALERAWSGRLQGEELDEEVAALREAHLEVQRGLVGSAVDDFFLYDEVLETAMMLGLVPDELASAHRGDPFGLLTALARGTPQREAWEMTKWFDTNYHFVVPIVDRLPSELQPLPWREPTDTADTAWAILGPYSLVKLSKLTAGTDASALASAVGRSSGRGHAIAPPRLRPSACSSTSQRSGWR